MAFGLVSRAGGRLRLDEFAFERVASDAGREEAWLERARPALAALRGRVKHPGPVVLTLPGHQLLAKHIKTPRVEPAKRARVIRFEAEQSIPYALADVAWDHVASGEGELDLDVLLLAAKLDAVESLCSAVEQAGFPVQRVLPAPLATLGAVQLLPAAKSSSVVLNLGARSTLLLLVGPGRFSVRTIALGGAGLTQQIATAQQCDAADAESIKCSERTAHLAAPAMETYALRLAQEVTRTVLHFRRQSAGETPDRVWLTGGGARLAGLAEFLAARLKVPVERLDALSAIEIGRQPADANAASQALGLVDLLGAAAALLKDGSALADLRPPRLKQQAVSRRRAPWFAAAAVLALGAFLPPVLHHRAVATEARAKAAAIEAELAPLRQREARNRANLAKLAALQPQAAALQGVAARRDRWLALLADLQDRLGKVEDVWLERMQVAADGGAAGAGAPLRITVSGRMLDRANPLSKASPDTYARVKTLLGSITESPFVAAVQGERFDGNQPGILRFDFILVAESTSPL